MRAPTDRSRSTCARDGPHGLVAGTTGSGKSELLQTLIASLAVGNRPDEINFVLVDYKGGAAFKDCNHLPHTVGMVTDLDGHLTTRALESLGAELRRREHQLAAAGRQGHRGLPRPDGARGRTPMPRLLIVIDEFAALVAELPDFVTGLVDIARRGRSLGVHLILATQRPAGVVSAEIKSNTNLRIALRVTDAGDSADVIESPDAAQIAKSTPAALRPARALLADPVPELARRRPSGRCRRGSSGSRRSTGRPPHLVGRVVGGLADEETTSASPPTWSALVAAINEANDELGLPLPRKPWLPALPEMIGVDNLGGRAALRRAASASERSVETSAASDQSRPPRAACRRSRSGWPTCRATSCRSSSPGTSSPDRT